MSCLHLFVFAKSSNPTEVNGLAGDKQGLNQVIGPGPTLLTTAFQCGWRHGLTLTPACLGEREQTYLLHSEVTLKGSEKLQGTFPPSLISPPCSPAAAAAPPAGSTRIKGAGQTGPSLW